MKPSTHQTYQKDAVVAFLSCNLSHIHPTVCHVSGLFFDWPRMRPELVIPSLWVFLVQNSRLIVGVMGVFGLGVEMKQEAAFDEGV